MVRSVLVTGASGGIGSAICELMGQAGFEVLGVDKQPSNWTDGLSFDLEDVDLSEKLRSNFPLSGLTTIIHAAAWQSFGAMHDQPADAWNRALLTNVVALSNLVSHFRKELSSNHGSVVAIGSVHSIASRSGIGLYAVSKAALEGWVRAAALELAPSVRVNSVIPGAVNSGSLQEFIDSSGEAGPLVYKRISERAPLRRIGTPLDVAQAVAFLASEGASFITGQSLVVDGGATGLLGTEVE